METKPEALKSHVAIRCVKVAILLSSLKWIPDRNLNAQNHRENEEMLMKEVRDLKIKLVGERMKNKRIVLYSSIEFVMLMLLLFTSFLVLVLALPFYIEVSILVVGASSSFRY